MKKYIVIFLFLLTISTLSFSQTINDISFESIECEYMKLICGNEHYKSKNYIVFDFGRENEELNKKKQIIKNEKGEEIFFFSMIDALNFMSKQGYELVDSYVVEFSGIMQTHYLLRKKKY
jgi:hypothetical protein